jgi:hypothetical protein
LNHPAGISGWIPFRVLPALQPELYTFSEEFLPAGDGMEITLYGRNLVEGSELHLDPAEGAAVAPPAYLPAGESARLIFSGEPPAPGRYRVHIKNPGGLETSLDITVGPPPAADSGNASAAPDSGDSGDSSAVPAPVPRRPLGLYVTAEYVPLFPLYGDLFDRLGRSFYPAGVSARIAFMFFKPSRGDLGLELAPSWNMLDAGAITIRMYPLHLNGVYQLRFPGQKTALVFRLGGGITLLQGTNSQSSGSIFTWMPSAAGEADFRWYPAANARQAGYNAFYCEIGLEYTHLFSSDSPQPGYIRPVLGAGWIF